MALLLSSGQPLMDDTSSFDSNTPFYEAEVEQQTEIDEYKAQIQRELETFNKPFDNSDYRGTIDAIEVEVVLFGTWAKMINEAKSHSDPSVVSLGEELESKVSELQIKEFPLMRKAYADFVANILWEHDIEVRVVGNANGTIEFIGGYFAANKNIKDTHLLFVDLLKALRFDRANYKWSEYADYTYYTLESSKDSEIVELN